MKLLHLEINTCKDCPYSDWDDYYGWFCSKLMGKLIAPASVSCPSPPDFCPLPNEEIDNA